MVCPICQTDNPISIHKPLKGLYRHDNSMYPSISQINYSTCSNCGCCYTLDEFSPETHNQSDKPRNLDNVNKLRLERIEHYGPENIETVIDFGCGNGQFVDFASTFFEEVIGIDQDTKPNLSDIQSNSTDVINCVEVIEHLINPKPIVQEFERVLKVGGIIYLESSFTDFLGEPQKAGYIDPNIGHVLVHSRKSIEMLFEKFEAKWLNNNVVIFKKV